MPWNNPWYMDKGGMYEFFNNSAGNVWFIMSCMAEVTCKSIGGILGMAYTQVALVLLLPPSFAFFLTSLSANAPFPLQRGVVAEGLTPSNSDLKVWVQALPSHCFLRRETLLCLVSLHIGPGCSKEGG